MTRSILVGLAILTLSTSSALAWHHRAHHSRAMDPNASAAAMNQNPYAAPNPYGGPVGPNPYARPIGPYTYGGPLGANAFAGPPAGVSSSDRDMYLKNLHDSGYDPKSDYQSNGIIKTQ